MTGRGSLAVICSMFFLMMWGCGGGGGGGVSGSQSTVSLSGTVSFPTSNAVSNPVPGAAAKTVNAAAPLPTVTVYDLKGNVLGQTTASANGASYSYTVSGLNPTDFMVKANQGSTTIKALIDKASVTTSGSSATVNVDTISTTAVILAEQSLNVPVGSLGTSANTVSSSQVAAVQPVALETTVANAVATVLNAPGAATQASVTIINLVNVVTAAVASNSDPSSIIASSQTPGNTGTAISTVQYTYNAGTGAAAGAAAPVTATAISSVLADAASGYTPPPAASVSYQGAFAVLNASGSTATPVPGAMVTTVGLTQPLSATTDSNGQFMLVGIPQGTSFSLHITAPRSSGYIDVYSSALSFTANTDATSVPYGALTASQLTGFGNSAGNGMIRTRVATSSATGYALDAYVGGATVTATDADSSVSYPVKYTSTILGGVSSLVASTDPGNGIFTVLNVPDGHTVTVTASANGYTFNTRSYTVHAGAVSQGRLIGSASGSNATNPIAAALQAGFYSLNSDSYTTNGSNVSTTVYSYDLISYLGNIMNDSQTFFSPATGGWTTTAPAGITSTRYGLSATGWVQVTGGGPNGYNIVFNNDGSATLFDPIEGTASRLTLASDDISKQTIASVFGTASLPVTSGSASFPSGSTAYSITMSQYDDSYEIWAQQGALTSLVGTPGAVQQVFIDQQNNNSNTDYYCTFDASGSTATIYQSSNGTSSSIGSATWAITTVAGKQIIEISIPAAIRTQYQLAGNPIVTIMNGYAWIGSHTLPGTSKNQGAPGLNLTALNFLKSQFSVPLAKAAAKRAVSRTILGF